MHLADVGHSSGYYVEVGTQSGEQCNTRYLRVRYGFHGVMLDDNFRNKHVNLKRRFVTPSPLGMSQKSLRCFSLPPLLRDIGA